MESRLMVARGWGGENVECWLMALGLPFAFGAMQKSWNQTEGMVTQLCVSHMPLNHTV